MNDKTDGKNPGMEYAKSGTGGDSSHSAKGVGVKTGLSQSSGFMDESPESLGMGSTGADQKPEAMPKTRVGKFSFR